MILLNSEWMPCDGGSLLAVWLDEIKIEVFSMATAYKLSEKSACAFYFELIKLITCHMFISERKRC